MPSSWGSCIALSYMGVGVGSGDSLGEGGGVGDGSAVEAGVGVGIGAGVGDGESVDAPPHATKRVITRVVANRNRMAVVGRRGSIATQIMPQLNPAIGRQHRRSQGEGRTHLPQKLAPIFDIGRARDTKFQNSAEWAFTVR